MFGNRPMTSNQRHPFQMPGPDRFNSLPTTVKNTTPIEGGITRHLERFQQVLSVVERTTPYIEEYGPFIKNLPQMYRMIKAFKSLEDDDTDDISPAQEINSEQQEVNVEEPLAQDINDDGLSKPKLFI